MKEKYIELLLKRCLKIEDTNSLFVSYNVVNKDFVKNVVKYANKLGIEDVYLDEEDSNHIHDLLKNTKLEDISNLKEFNSKSWDEYAKKDAAFLMFDTFIPNLMDDIDSEALEKMSQAKRNSKPIYKERQLNSEIAWCIAVLPNEEWAKEIFEESDNPLEEFWNTLGKMCMLDKENPIQEWDKFLKQQEQTMNKLNDLQIKKLHFKNRLGTDLLVELSEKALWQSASSGKWIVNMPSYEVFTTPDFRKTEGTVYSSKYLVYNGKQINNFDITFEEGKVSKFDAKEGKDILKEIINSDEMSSYLGEVALVNYDSPISNTQKVFKSTLFDENASCHLALGSGFLECIEGADKLGKDELKELGVNNSKNHVDFMIGTEDLEIVAETKKGKVTIMKNGNIII